MRIFISLNQLGCRRLVHWAAPGGGQSEPLASDGAWEPLFSKNSDILLEFRLGIGWRLSVRSRPRLSWRRCTQATPHLHILAGRGRIDSFPELPSSVFAAFRSLQHKYCAQRNAALADLPCVAGVAGG